MKRKKPWGGRFKMDTDRMVEAFTSSLAFDRNLAGADIRGSIAHARMLAKQKIITAKDARAIIRGLEEIRREIDSGGFPWREDLEDIHMNIEARLIEKTGEAGKRLHTARSRNDQVATDLRLYLKERLAAIDAAAGALQKALIGQAKRHLGAIMPGYTHLQQAQPVLFSHHLMAYVEMLGRDRGRLRDAFARADVLPLGAGALAGTPFPIDRAYVAKLLGFSKVAENSIDAVSDRDFAVEFLSAVALLMVHLSRFCEELVLWSTTEFGFVELSDAFCTGSSIMPNKKNPDVAELVRGKTGRVVGGLVSLLTTLKGLPLSYNKDLQEDKEPVFDAADTAEQSLLILAQAVATMAVHAERMRAAASGGFLTATDAADYLVEKGVPFREAHHLVGGLVAHCIDAGRALDDLTAAELRKFSPKFGADAARRLTAESSVASRKSTGGTARATVAAAIRKSERTLSKLKPLPI
ncbi:MAG: argininosuccinate lyase [Deltaproteobacteria bacterium]|nr:argininosuccinate lyase [Deltaproteobacteria bacterium]